ncbi:hypothetical protein [Mucilaginibacter psychrotolerans]|uniref:Uncharacterized protein n=1 Tax=Mucilaginibacter psychrotolerans TaxID=1524096 RepID=A0A4Y8SBF6_9SPHI|nr:hypothetical protein [Mucilaginibacter psychrotolerans]TFF35981.1 hypothetical protein E2R66_17335 [Mucilaginibacter psychrotolerans]
MKKFKFLLLIIPLSLSCQSAKERHSTGAKGNELNVGPFTINAPANWKANIPKDQKDSLIGSIEGPKVSLSFDFSTMGYANHLISSQQQYLNRGEWYFDQRLSTRVDLADHFQTDKKTFAEPTAAQKLQFPKADLMAYVTHVDSVFQIPIEIPAEIKTHNIVVDSTELYIIKTIWPKAAGKGMTGIYMQSRKTSLNLQMSGEDLPKEQQELALKAFKTIKIKVEGSSPPLPFQH